MRRIAREHNVDIAQIQGTGIGGRVTKQDILGFIESGRRTDAASAAAPRSRGARAGLHSRARTSQVVPMSVMRRKIAEHMVLSAHTSPHVYSVYEVNFGRVARCASRRRPSTKPPAPS